MVESGLKSFWQRVHLYISSNGVGCRLKYADSEYQIMLHFSEMLPDIEFRATFVRVHKDPLKGTASVIHMDENLSYLSPSDGVIHVNENHKLVVEKVLQGPQFAKLLHDISDLVQEEPRQIQRQPKPLLLTASFAASQHMTAKQATEQPPALIEATACHLPPEELLDFLKLNNYSAGLMKALTTDGFQRFLLHLLKTIENDKLPLNLRRDFKTELAKLNMDVHDFNTDVEKSKKPFVWFIAALGCFGRFVQFVYHNIYEHAFYLLKFRERQGNMRYPIPQVPKVFLRIVPQNDCLELPNLGPTVTPFLCAYKNPLDFREHFFLLLCAFQEARWRGCHHEVFAYAMHIMSEEKFMNDPLLQKYQLHLWGGLSVSLAKIHTPEVYALSCLAKTKSFVKCFSNVIDVLLLKQQVMAAFQQYAVEDACFRDMMELVPMSSNFFRQSVIIHMSCQTKKLEDTLLELWSRKKRISTEGLENSKAFGRLAVTFEKECLKHKRWMHMLCGKTDCLAYVKTYEQQIFLMDLFIELGRRCYNLGGNDVELKRIIFNLSDQHSQLKPLLQFVTQEISFEQYYTTMHCTKQAIQKQTKTMEPLAWADVCYMQLIAFKLFRNVEPEVCSSEFYEDAHKIYKHNEHPRAERLETHYRDKRDYRPRAFQDNINHFCSIMWIAKTAPRVGKLIRHGVSSATKFDIQQASNLWYPYE